MKKLAFIKQEFLAGLTTSLAMIPESMAFAIMATVSPLIGLYTAAIVSIIAALLGRKALVSGCAGAIAVVSMQLIMKNGIEYLFPAVILMGVIQLLFGLFKLGKYIKLITPDILAGFLNGLAVIIFISQFMHLTNGNVFVNTGVAILTTALIFISGRYIKRIPAALIGVMAVVTICAWFRIDIKTIASISEISSNLPIPNLGYFLVDLKTWWVVLPYAITMAIIGLLESLLTMRVVDERIGETGDPNKEGIAIGASNVACGVLGGMGGCGMIGQTVVNLESGGRDRWSGVFVGISIFIFIFLAGSLIEAIPLPALAGLMFFVAIKAMQWRSITNIKSNPIKETVIMLIVTIITVITHNLAIAVLIGLLCNFVYSKLHRKSNEIQQIGKNEAQN